MPRRGWLQALGLHRPELRAWALYDWANSGFVVTIVTAVFPIYFVQVAAAGLTAVQATTRFATATTIALAIAAIISPVLGALADASGIRKRLLGVFLVGGVAATAGLAAVGRGDWRLGAALFVAGNVALAGTFVFYDSLLPHVASADEVDRVSTAGYALGYVGGGILLAGILAAIQHPRWFGLANAAIATRVSFVAVAIWWLVFSIPLFRTVREPPAAASPRGSGLAASFSQLRETASALGRHHRQALLLLVAFLLYNDGIGTIIRMAAAYGTEVGIGRGALIAAILLVQFIGIPFSFLFGAAARWIGAKNAILAALAVYALTSVVAYFMRTAAHFFALAVLVAMVQGGSQALSRSLFASMTPRQRSAEFFALFGISEKVAGIVGPALFAATAAITGSSRSAILSVILFFVAGGALLLRVDVEAGRSAARAAEAP